MNACKRAAEVSLEGQIEEDGSATSAHCSSWRRPHAGPSAEVVVPPDRRRPRRRPPHALRCERHHTRGLVATSFLLRSTAASTSLTPPPSSMSCAQQLNMRRGPPLAVAGAAHDAAAVPIRAALVLLAIWLHLARALVSAVVDAPALHILCLRRLQRAAAVDGATRVRAPGVLSPHPTGDLPLLDDRQQDPGASPAQVPRALLPHHACCCGCPCPCCARLLMHMAAAIGAHAHRAPDFCARTQAQQSRPKKAIFEILAGSTHSPYKIGSFCGAWSMQRILSS